MRRSHPLVRRSPSAFGPGGFLCEMQLPVDIELTEPQLERIDKITGLLGCDPNDVEITHAPDLPPRWISATVGTEKGRPKTFDIDPEGVPIR